MKKNPGLRKDIVVYGGKNGVEIEVLADADTVWLNRQQLAKLFGRDVKTIGKHIANALAEALKGFSTVAKFETVQIEGKRSGSITETLQRMVEVEAATAEDAERKIRTAYLAGDIVLDAEDCTDVEIVSRSVGFTRFP